MKAKNVFQMWMLVSGLFLISLVIYGQSEETIVTPKDHFGFTPGDDRMLFDYDEMIEYLKLIDEASPKMKLVDIGKSPLGKTMYIAFLSSAENISNLEELKKINRDLALNHSIPDSERTEMIDKGKVFVLGTLSMHSGEVGPAQAAPLIAYDLVTTEDEKILNWMDQVVYMMVPNHNPDGMDFIVQNYRKYKGTKYEGASLPRVYHKYVGHNINRDFVNLTQDDNRAVLEW